MKHLMINMQVSKSNRVRLEAARRTIDELEARPDESNANGSPTNRCAMQAERG
jgi:hypothetical protein